MPPETTPVTTETLVTPPTTTEPAVAANSPEARNPDGSLKEGLSAPATETPKPETKTTEASTESGKTLLNGKKPEAAGAPEKYEFKGLPEGLTVPDDVQASFREEGLTQKQAQKMVDFYVQKSKEAAEAPAKYWKDMNDQWRGQIEKDPEYKGDMQNLNTSVSRLLDGLGDPKLVADFRQAMDFTGAGNNPAFAKVMFRLAQQLNEGSYVKPGNPSPHGQRAPGSNERPSAAKALFPGLS